MTSAKQMLFTAVSLFIAAVVPPAFGIPLTDVSSTSVDVHATRSLLRSHAPRFAISVHRVDDVLSDSGELIAERRIAYDISFTVAYKGGDKLEMNGVPVQPAMEKVKLTMDADIAIDARKLGELEAATGKVIRTPEGAEKAAESVFDTGVVTVDVAVDHSIINVEVAPNLPLIPVRRFVLTENVVELNGRVAIQTSVGKQIFYVLPDGSFAGLTGEADWTNVSERPAPIDTAQNSATAKNVVTEEAMDYAHEGGCGASEMKSRMTNWLRAHPLSTVLLVSLVAAAFAAIYAGVGAVIRRLRPSRLEVGNNAAVVAASKYRNEKDLASSPPRYESLPQGSGEAAAPSRNPGVGENEADSLCQ